ncbi:MAG: tetratricopeptide repeat protein [Spirochaetaceae bacterium]|nr:MAG: tetratricopeptide repeat protein [Spirochaetaceae bacterium]
MHTSWPLCTTTLHYHIASIRRVGLYLERRWYYLNSDIKGEFMPKRTIKPYRPAVFLAFCLAFVVLGTPSLFADEFEELIDSAESAYEVGRLVEAYEAYSQALELEPDMAELVYNRGVVAYDLERFEDAITDFSRTLELSDGHFGAYYNRGNAHFLLEDFVAAEQDFSRAVAIDAEDVSARYNLATTLYRLEDHRQAIVEFRVALDLDPDLAEAHYNIALAHIRLAEELGIELP